MALLFFLSCFWLASVKKRFKNAIVAIINEVHHSEAEKNDYDDNDNVTYAVNKQFPLSKIEKTEVYLDETGNDHLRYLSNTRSMGMVRLVSGMTFANNPLI